MFKKSLNLTQLKPIINGELKELAGGEAIQVMQRDSEVKVIITQEEFFRLKTAERMAFGTKEEPVETTKAALLDKAMGLSSKYSQID
jgi:hypothetical protein